MDKQQLLATLEKLREELESTDSVDEQTRLALYEVAGDINRQLERGGEPSTEELKSSRESLHDLLLEFEAEHPRVAETLGRLADGLQNLGI